MAREPTTSDGRQILLTSRFRGDVDPYFAGCGDDPTKLTDSPPTDGRGEGMEFQLGWSTSPGSADDKNLEWQFNDWVYISGGRIRWVGGNAGDTATFKMYAPATTVTTASPVNTGNCNLTDLGGFNLITPAAGDGTHDVADADKVPVPAVDSEGSPNGYWDWDDPDEGRGSVTAGTAGAAGCNLFDVSIDLVKWIVKMQLIGNGIEPISPETKARKIYPPWKFRLDLYNAGSSAIQVAWTMDLARKKTT